ncbi:4Fe-4S cluster-binding domain-containing protein, partial [Escherichia coli]
ILKLVKRVKTQCPEKDIWVWTGYLLADLTPEQQEVVSYINVLIDGKFVQELYDPALLWRGSSNQVIHKLK